MVADGLDELKQTAQEASDQVRRIAEQVNNNPKLKAAILSRPFSTEFGENITLDGVVRLELEPLSLNKTIIFLKKICTDLSPSSRLFEDLKKSALFHQLPKSPIATILLARILSEKKVDLPSSLPELYRKYFELALGRWDIQRGLQSEKEYEALNAVLMELADYLMENELETISYDEALGAFTDYLTNRNLNIAPEHLLDIASSRCPIL